MSGTVPGKIGNLVRLALAELFIMALWFSASAVVLQLQNAWALGDTGAAWLTMSVQLGFAIGALGSALLNLPDRMPLPRLIALSGTLGVVANAAIVIAPGLGAVLALRFLTGVALAGVYPPAMKIVSTWTTSDRGLGIGFLVGAITLGSASPHLLNATGDGMPPWRAVLLGASALATLGSILVALGVRAGPHLGGSAPFDWRFVGRALAHRPTRLANIGYLGHMWELYAMWAWVPIFLIASYDGAGLEVRAARLAGFATLAAGSVGCVVAGALADRLGRTTITIGSLTVSGSCALLAGFLFGSPIALTVLCIAWGFFVVADSAQFSTAVTELTDPRYVGSALTMQTSLGFLLTMLTIQLAPAVERALGWSGAFAMLAIGPAAGIVAMAKLRRSPEAAAMASGRR